VAGARVVFLSGNRVHFYLCPFFIFLLRQFMLQIPTDLPGMARGLLYDVAPFCQIVRRTAAIRNLRNPAHLVLDGCPDDAQAANDICGLIL
jgi:hypothetical protein